MWSRLRLDIGWRDLIAGFFYCLGICKRSEAVTQAEQSWSCDDNFLITLSVRSGFDLLLRSLQLPAGSEVLFSALTVPDMVHIVKLHGLVPVPVDVDDKGKIDLESFKNSLSPQSRMIVVAHLFGGYDSLDELLKIARQHDLFVVEDCAQCFCKVGETRNSASDVAMYSFGPIKTATALGGAVIRISSPDVHNRMALLLRDDPVQSRLHFARRVARFMTVKALSGKRIATTYRRLVELFGYDFDSLANSLAKSFDSSNLLAQIRWQPSIPLLRLLRRRWLTYDFSRIQRRIHMGRRLDAHLGNKHSAEHNYWVYPLLVEFPQNVRDRFQAAGFDATCQTRMVFVRPIDGSQVPGSAKEFLDHVVFLPWYPELPDDALEQMASLIEPSEMNFGASTN